MKVGDKVFCIKDYKTLYNNFLCGYEYEIIYIIYVYDRIISVYLSYGKGNSDYTIFDIDSYNKTFVDVKGYRKMKLKQIYESR